MSWTELARVGPFDRFLMSDVWDRGIPDSLYILRLNYVYVDAEYCEASRDL
jgi:hypothetical protein